MYFVGTKKYIYIKFFTSKMTKFQAGIFMILYIVWNYPAPDFLIAFWRQKCMDFRNIFVALYTILCGSI